MKTLEDILPQEFYDIINSGWYDDDGGVWIESYQCLENDLRINLILNSGDEEIPQQLWEINITDFKSQRINIKWENNISFYCDHFLLWEYTDNITSLYFNDKSETPDELLSDIYRLHRREFGQEFEIEKYLNNCIDFSSLCHSDFGLFAKGPKKILDLYFLCLEKHKMMPYYYDYEILKNTLNSDLAILILGSSYFIGKDFKFQKLNNLIP